MGTKAQQILLTVGQMQSLEGLKNDTVQCLKGVGE